MQDYECVIGLWYDYEDTDIVTLSELLQCAEQAEKTYNYLKELHERGGELYSRPKPYSIQDYLDSRKTTNFNHFEYCPFCGKKINWERLRKENKQ